MLSTVLIIQHLPHEHAGTLGEALELAQVDTRTVRSWTGQPVPHSPSGVDAVVVLGGDMNTDEDDVHPHLRDVRRLLRTCVDADVPALGLCLGAQLLAEATGGTVRHGTPEIGYPATHLTDAGRAHPVLAAAGDGTAWFNAHADFISLGPDAVLLARSDAAPVHAFAVGSAVGLQFHPEIDASFVAGYVGADGVDTYLRGAGTDPDHLVAEARRRNADVRAAGLRLLGAWVADAVGAPGR